MSHAAVDSARSPLRFAVMANRGTGAVFVEELVRCNLRPLVVVTQDPFYVAGASTLRSRARSLARRARFALRSRPLRRDYDTFFLARERGLATFPAQLVNTARGSAFLEALQLDYIFVFTFRILKDFIFRIPRFGTINCHSSLLPAYKGPCPDFWMVRNGEVRAGITFHYVEEKVDSGEVLAQHVVSASTLDDSESLRRRLLTIGAREFVAMIIRLDLGFPTSAMADREQKASHQSAPRVEDMRITADMDGSEVIRVARASRSYGYARWEHAGKEHKVADAFGLAVGSNGEKELEGWLGAGRFGLRTSDGKVVCLVLAAPGC